MEDAADDGGCLGGRRSGLRPVAGRWRASCRSRISRAPKGIDFGDVTIRLGGEQVKCCLFSFRMFYSGKAVHRIFASGGQEVLLAKPGALAGSQALDQARREGTFTPSHEAFWSAAQSARGEIDGTKELVGVLLLHRRLAHRDVVAGIRAALMAGAHTAEIVALEARKTAQTEGRSPTVTTNPALPEPITPPELDLPSRTAHRAARVGRLPDDQRPLPALTR